MKTKRSRVNRKPIHWSINPLGKKKYELSSHKLTILEFRIICSNRQYSLIVEKGKNFREHISQIQKTVVFFGYYLTYKFDGDGSIGVLPFLRKFSDICHSQDN